MTTDVFNLYTLMEMSRQIKTAPRFWLNKFFTKQINFDGREIIFEKVYGDDRKLAPFAVPTAAGRPQKLSGFEARTFAPAYVKQKDVVDPTMHLERLAGEALGGSLTIQQRRDAVRAELLRMQKEKIQNRWNWMAARAAVDGKVLISGEDYPETLVDFRRDAELTKVLTLGAKWDQATANPLADLKDCRLAANELCGARISLNIFGANAWELFCERVDLTALQNSINRGAGQQTTVTTMSDGYGDTLEYMGSMQGLNGQGRMEFWVDTTRYIDPETGAEEYYLDQNTVVGISDLMAGVRCFGAIMDGKAGFRPLDMFFKNWENEDPSVEYLLSQSAPLMVPKEPNATYSIKVA
jgi:hypothetical protein